MKICGIVAEYNPFHNGHKYHIEQARILGATHIVCVMSGSFVQRGELAILNKWERARAAVLGGADLVVELPVCYSLAAAETFARASLHILGQLGAQSLCFGSECGNIALLQKSAKAVKAASSSELLGDKLSAGVSYPAALSAAVSELFGEKAAIPLSQPNDTLAIEYINAIHALGLTIEPMSIKRAEIGHDSDIAGENFASASHIRSLIKSADFDEINRYIPETEQLAVRELHTAEEQLSPMVLYKLKTMSPVEFALLPDVCEGLEHRLFKAANEATTLSEFFTLAKTKRYTLARIRRIAYLALLGITKSSVEFLPPFVRVLALNERGQQVLAGCKKTISIKVATKFSSLEPEFSEQIKSDVLATDLLNLTVSPPRRSKADFMTSPILL